ncbi:MULTISPECIES: TetR/AcrR family transcriptional regulator [unclassified Dietzia]|uniref:TetR/AcrR family transcriptional regulator n=1 Tax=unclassified Dietzia TaxID=2617939 RepID=UPI0015FADB88|nr:MULTISPECIES: TetR/AcrR family transcriptional regulator [unclassified Dietzia]MBB1024016.1 TetR/AcrR family transcriptional regulator [Dietzia sp. DQ12-76]MBB1027795.1 TetR/AcrR family transcriptional regulator [Dietzia sp. DQ11-38-2]
MPTLRSDAARSRAKILEAARRQPISELRLNDLARQADVGVATVYRHFPTVTALVEALTLEALDQLVDKARAAAEEPDPSRAFTQLVRETATRQLQHEGLQLMLLSDETSTAVRGLRDELFGLAQTTLTNAIAAGAVRPDISLDQVQRLVCGVEHAVRLGDGSDRDQLLEVVLAGLSPT